jgi:hypothetical protein
MLVLRYLPVAWRSLRVQLLFGCLGCTPSNKYWLD